MARRLEEALGIQRIGRSLVVRPSWVDYKVRGGETVIQIDPGMAFGTGQHPTTAMCLRAIEECVRPGMRVLDLGSGSGILGIAAAKLGAGRILAIDLDPQAVKATNENAGINGMTGILEAREGTLERAEGEKFDIIVANIRPHPSACLADIARALAEGGLLVASGFLEDAVERVKGAFGSQGLLIERVVEEGVWRAILARRA